MVDDAFSGGLAFGLTSWYVLENSIGVSKKFINSDPTLVPASRLPVDSDELLERPEYWVCIKDVGATPQVGDKLSFRVDSDGTVFYLILDHNLNIQVEYFLLKMTHQKESL